MVGEYTELHISQIAAQLTAFFAGRLGKSVLRDESFLIDQSHLFSIDICKIQNFHFSKVCVMLNSLLWSLTKINHYHSTTVK